MLQRWVCNSGTLHWSNLTMQVHVNHIYCCLITAPNRSDIYVMHGEKVCDQKWRPVRRRVFPACVARVTAVDIYEVINGSLYGCHRAHFRSGSNFSVAIGSLAQAAGGSQSLREFRSRSGAIQSCRSPTSRLAKTFKSVNVICLVCLGFTHLCWRISKTTRTSALSLYSK